MRGYWLDGTTERKLFEHRKFETSITRQGIPLFFNTTCTNNYHKIFDKRIFYRKRNGNAVFTKRLGNVFDETESITYSPANFLTYREPKTNYLFLLKNNSTTEINDLAELKNDSAADTNGFAEWKFDSAAVVNDFAELKNDFAAVTNDLADVTNDFAEVRNDFAEVKNDFAELKNDFAELRNGFAGLENDFAELENDFAEPKNGFAELKNGFAVYVKPLFSLKNEVCGVKSAILTDCKCNKNYLPETVKTVINVDFYSLTPRLIEVLMKRDGSISTVLTVWFDLHTASKCRGYLITKNG